MTWPPGVSCPPREAVLLILTSSMAVGGARARAVFSGTEPEPRTEVEPGRNAKMPPINIAENYPARVRDDDTEKIRKRANVYFMTTSGTAAARRARATLARAPVRSRTMSPWRERGRERGRPRDEPPDDTPRRRCCCCRRRRLRRRHRRQRRRRTHACSPGSIPGQVRRR